jgi:hypothetical protein
LPERTEMAWERSGFIRPMIKPYWSLTLGEVQTIGGNRTPIGGALFKGTREDKIVTGPKIDSQCDKFRCWRFSCMN